MASRVQYATSSDYYFNWYIHYTDSGMVTKEHRTQNCGNTLGSTLFVLNMPNALFHNYIILI